MVHLTRLHLQTHSHPCTPSFFYSSVQPRLTGLLPTSPPFGPSSNATLSSPTRVLQHFSNLLFQVFSQLFFSHTNLTCFNDVLVVHFVIKFRSCKKSKPQQKSRPFLPRTTITDSSGPSRLATTGTTCSCRDPTSRGLWESK